MIPGKIIIPWKLSRDYIITTMWITKILKTIALHTTIAW